MTDIYTARLRLVREPVIARFIDPAGRPVEREVEIRSNPITGRTARVAKSRIHECEPGTETLPEPPPDAEETAACPFCPPQVTSRTPRLIPEIAASGRLVQGRSILFPNLFPYGPYSAVSLFDDQHYVPIGTASPDSYADGFINAGEYLRRVGAHDPAAIYLAVTQNHLPSAGGSLVHPHLQIQADEIPANHHRFLRRRTDGYARALNGRLFADLVLAEFSAGARYIGATGPWEWLAAHAPDGFFELWGIYPGATSLTDLSADEWGDLAEGVINAQRFYRSLCRNGYNLGLLSVETPDSALELRCVIQVRSNYAPWVRNDHTGFEVMLGDMATFSLPEETARLARPFWNAGQGDLGPSSN